MGSAPLDTAAFFWIATETESTAAILQACRSGTPASTQDSSGIIVAEFFPPNIRNRASAMGCETRIGCGTIRCHACIGYFDEYARGR